MEPNKFDFDKLSRRPHAADIVACVDRGDTLIIIAEPDQNWLNFFSSKGYSLVHALQCGRMDEQNGMSYDCIFKRNETTSSITRNTKSTKPVPRNQNTFDGICPNCGCSMQCRDTHADGTGSRFEYWNCHICKTQVETEHDECSGETSKDAVVTRIY